MYIMFSLESYSHYHDDQNKNKTKQILNKKKMGFNGSNVSLEFSEGVWRLRVYMSSRI